MNVKYCLWNLFSSSAQSSRNSSVVVEEICVVMKSNYAIFAIVFYHHMFDFNTFLIISKFTIPS